MAKYLFIYHGGSHPETEAEVAEVMDAWGKWLGDLGASVIDGGNPVGMSSTVMPDGSVVDNGGANPVSGYGIFDASDRADAIAKAQGCPIRAAGGSIELADIVDM
ncbi:MAG: hypothetical protein AAF385_06275 [Pseudomonadota bacterium]